MAFTVSASSDGGSGASLSLENASEALEKCLEFEAQGFQNIQIVDQHGIALSMSDLTQLAASTPNAERAERH